jgi:mRNA-degrading endonuclease toxin of MazEF toxin-antitoxin module
MPWPRPTVGRPDSEGSRLHRIGHIVIVEAMLDPQGRNPKDRPCVVVYAPPNDSQDRSYRVVGITTTLPDELTVDHVALPWQRPRHPVTGLNQRNAALCTWVAVIDESRIARRIGNAPPRPLLAIAEALTRLSSDLDPSPR